MRNNSLEYEPGVLRVFQSKAETKAFYNKIARVYDLLAEHSEHTVRQKALAEFSPSPGEHLLEIGAGTGHCLVEMADAVGPKGKVFAIDIAESMVARALAELREESLDCRAEITCCDAEHLPYQSESMDGVFMTFVLELFDTPAIPRVLAECHRVLRPAGRLVVAGMSKEGEQGLLVHAFEWTHRHFPNLLDCRPIYVGRAVEAAHFVIQDSQVTHMWVPVEIIRAIKPQRE